MAIEDILNRVSEDIQNKRKSILKEAEKEREKIIKETKEKAENIFKEIILKEEKKAKLEQARLIALARLESQKEILSFKRKILDDIFKKVRDNFPLKGIRKKIITPDKEWEEDLDIDKYLEEIRPSLELKVLKILWPEQ